MIESLCEEDDDFKFLPSKPVIPRRKPKNTTSKVHNLNENNLIDIFSSGNYIRQMPVSSSLPSMDEDVLSSKSNFLEPKYSNYSCNDMDDPDLLLDIEEYSSQTEVPKQSVDSCNIMEYSPTNCTGRTQSQPVSPHRDVIDLTNDEMITRSSRRRKKLSHSKLNEKNSVDKTSTSSFDENSSPKNSERRPPCIPETTRSILLDIDKMLDSSANVPKAVPPIKSKMKVNISIFPPIQYAESKYFMTRSFFIDSSFDTIFTAYSELYSPDKKDFRFVYDSIKIFSWATPFSLLQDLNCKNLCMNVYAFLSDDWPRKEKTFLENPDAWKQYIQEIDICMKAFSTRKQADLSTPGCLPTPTQTDKISLLIKQSSGNSFWIPISQNDTLLTVVNAFRAVAGLPDRVHVNLLFDGKKLVLEKTVESQDLEDEDCLEAVIANN